MRSTQERLINKTDSVLDVGNYINASPHKVNATSSLERTQTKTVSFFNIHINEFLKFMLPLYIFIGKL